MNPSDIKIYPYYLKNGKSAEMEELLEKVKQWRSLGEKIITTNGCFDLLHSGHTTYLNEARQLGDRLIVGLNSDRSVHLLKGEGKPILAETDRAMLLNALQSVDAVVVFDDLLPITFLEQIGPDIHVKAGDYTPSSLPEASMVESLGGTINILSIKEGVSTSLITERIKNNRSVFDSDGRSEKGQELSTSTEEAALRWLLDSSNLFRQSAYSLLQVISDASELITKTLKKGNKILLCGNGGSAADSQHIAAEFVGRFRRERIALPAIALTTDSSILTAIGNDYGYNQVFRRQVEAIGQNGDLLIAISTSGNSESVVLAAEEATKKGMQVIAFTGSKASLLSEASNLTIAVPSNDTAMIQQIHIGILHLLCDLSEKEFQNPS